MAVVAASPTLRGAACIAAGAETRQAAPGRRLHDALQGLRRLDSTAGAALYSDSEDGFRRLQRRCARGGARVRAMAGSGKVNVVEGEHCWRSA